MTRTAMRSKSGGTPAHAWAGRCICQLWLSIVAVSGCTHAEMQPSSQIQKTTQAVSRPDQTTKLRARTDLHGQSL